MHQLKKSTAILERLKSSIPGGVNSPARSFQGMGVDPLVVDRGEGDILYDVDGNGYIDYIGSWGALIHGHAHPSILRVIHDQVDRGTTFGVSTEAEERLASKVVELIPSIEKVRFVSSGTEATMSAARLARGYTGRDLIVKFTGHYHGHADFFLAQAGSGVAQLPESSSKGVPAACVQATLCLPFNDSQAALELFDRSEFKDRIAAVIVEPVAGNMGVVPGSLEFLQLLRKKTEKLGAVLIFDEVMCGFRVGLQGAQGLYEITPDLTCLGKILGGGLPAAAFGGKKEIMDQLAPLGPVYQAGTLSGNPLAMESGYQALCLLEQPGFYEALQKKVGLLTKPIASVLDSQVRPACLQEVGSMLTIFFGLKQVKSYEDAKLLDRERFVQFFQHMLKEGILIPPSPFEAWFVSATHTEEHLIQTKKVIVDFLTKL